MFELGHAGVQANHIHRAIDRQRVPGVILNALAVDTKGLGVNDGGLAHRLTCGGQDGDRRHND